MDLPAPGPAGLDSSASSAERLLAALHTACSHDLPNQILSLQSLIHLISMDESSRLDDAGREYLARLQGISQRIGGIAEFQKAIVGLARTQVEPRRIALDELFRELRAESRSILKKPVMWDLRVAPLSVWADYDLMYPSIGDLVRAFAERAGPGEATVIVTSSRVADGIAIQIVVRGTGFDRTASVFDRRGDVVLAKERLRVAGVRVTMGPPRADEASVVLEYAAKACEQEKL